MDYVLGFYNVVVQEPGLRPFQIDNYFQTKEEALDWIDLLTGKRKSFINRRHYHNESKYYILDLTKNLELIDNVIKGSV